MRDESRGLVGAEGGADKGADGRGYRLSDLPVPADNPRETHSSLGYRRDSSYIPLMHQFFIRAAKIATLAAVSLSAFGQMMHQSRWSSESLAAKHIADANEKMKELKELTPIEETLMQVCRHNCADASPQLQKESETARVHREAAIDRLISQINGDIDAYIFRSVDPKDINPRVLRQSLNRILADVCLPPIFISTSTEGHSLILAYTLSKAGRMGRQGTAVTVRAYNLVDQHFELSDYTGSDMDGNGGVSVKELGTPIQGQIWLIASGYMTGANGPDSLMRVYAYDGKKFKAMWSPRDVWGSFAITITNQGFNVDGEYYRSSKKRHDKYSLSENGVHRD